MNNKLLTSILKIVIEITISFFAFFLICHFYFEFLLRKSSANDYEYDAIVAAPVLICTVIWVCTSRIIRAIKSNKQSENKDEGD